MLEMWLFFLSYQSLTDINTFVSLQEILISAVNVSLLFFIKIFFIYPVNCFYLFPPFLFPALCPLPPAPPQDNSCFSVVINLFSLWWIMTSFLIKLWYRTHIVIYFSEAKLNNWSLHFEREEKIWGFWSNLQPCAQLGVFLMSFSGSTGSKSFFCWCAGKLVKTSCREVR